MLMADPRSLMPRTVHPDRRRAFTILELLIVIAILLAIGALVVVNVMGSQEKADKRLTLVQLQAFQRALDAFKVDMKRYPTSEEGLRVLWTSEGLEDSDKSRWGGPYLTDAKPLDTWGSAWIYKNPAETEGVEFDIISIGPDKQEGSEDDISLAASKPRDDAGGDAFSDFKSPGTGVGGGSGGGSTGP